MKTSIFFICIFMASIVGAQNEIRFDKTEASEVPYNRAEYSIVVKLDSASPNHFYALFSRENQSIQNRYYTEKAKIKIKDLEKLEKDKEILKDGLCTTISKTQKIEVLYTKGKRNGVSKFFREGRLQSEVLYENGKRIQTTAYYPSGQPKLITKDLNPSEEEEKTAKISQQKSQKSSEFTEYYENGNLKRREIIKASTVIEQKHYTIDGRDTIFPVKPFEVAEQMPSFPGGEEKLMEYLKNNLKYPVEAMKDRISGRVVLRFIVDVDGNISDISIIRSLSPETDAEAIRVIEKMPKWIPGRDASGANVPVFYSFPIRFSLQEKIPNQNPGRPSGIRNTPNSRFYGDPRSR